MKKMYDESQLEQPALLVERRRKSALTTLLTVGGVLLVAGCGRNPEVTTTSTTAADRDIATAPAPATSEPAQASVAGEEKLEPTGRTNQKATMVLDEEKLDVQKREVDAGGVLIKKEVETRQVNQPVELREETIDIERLSPDQARERGIAVKEQAQRIGEKEVFVPLAREEAVVQKTVEPREVVTATTSTTTAQENVDATLRREVVEVERKGEAKQTAASQSPSSQPLEQRIRTALRNAQDLSLQEQQLNQININVEQDTVTLSGTVPTQDVAGKVEQSVRQIQGVTNVKNELRASQ